MKIGLDVMGGDFAPKAAVAGAILAHNELPETDSIVLIGDKEIIHSLLKEEGFDPNNFEIVHTSEVIEMCEQPTKAFSVKTDSSIHIGFKLLTEDKIQSFASAGNSGAMLVGSIYSVKAIPGILRPSSTAMLPKIDGSWNILLDIGTNPDCKPDVLCQFGLLGSIYAKYVFNIDKPRVGLLNIGAEDEKGNLLTHTAFKLMKDSKHFNFIGNIEGRDLYKDKADVIVCDGFTGNVVIKQAEALFQLMEKRGVGTNDEYFKRFNYENFGGTPILGINSCVLIGHGISNSIAFKNMLLLSKDVYEARLSHKIKEVLNHYV